MMRKDELLKRVGRMEQVASIRRYTLDDGKGRGMRAIEVSNGSGFEFTAYPDRGLDIGPASWNGQSIVWMTRNGPVNPAFYDNKGIEWLRTWMGGLLTTCGWINVGNPCATDNGEQGLHGRMDHTPAEEVNTRCEWVDAGTEGERYEMSISGRIVHARVFGENLVTTRTIRTMAGWPGVEIVDRTENLGADSAPLMQLYHMNFGWPLVGEGMRLVAPDHAITPRNAEAEKGLSEWATMPPPTKDFAEQVIYHDLPADEKGFCSIQICNDSFFKSSEKAALRLSFRKDELPYLVQWRQAGMGDYVMGLEPANCYPLGQDDFAKTGLLRRIEPGQMIETVVKVEIELMS